MCGKVQASGLNWIHSLHMHPSSLGPNLFPSSPYGVGDVAEACFLRSPSSSAITEGVNSICWIEVLGAPIPVRDFPCSLVGKEFACNTRDPGSIPGLEGNGSPLPYSSLENPMDRGTWRATVHGVERVRHDLVTTTTTTTIPIWRPGTADGCDISCLLIRQEGFSFPQHKVLRIGRMTSRICQRHNKRFWFRSLNMLFYPYFLLKYSWFTRLCSFIL